MKIQCVEIAEGSQQPRRYAGWLIVGKEYDVLEILIDIRLQKTEFRVISEDNQIPGVFPAKLFQIAANDLSPNWVAEVSESHVTLRPKRWSVPGFWEAYFNGDSKALSAFSEELEALARHSHSLDPSR